MPCQQTLRPDTRQVKILILKPSSLGDVVQALPVLRLLKLHLPQSEIFWWLEAGLRPLLEGDPDLAGIFPFNRQRWAAPKHWREIWSSVGAMRREQFDVAIDLQGLARSGLFTWLANAGMSIGFDNGGRGAREGARAAYDRVAHWPPASTHAVDRYLSVLPLLGVPVHRRFQWLPERPRAAAQVCAKNGGRKNTAGSCCNPAPAGRISGGRWNISRSWPGTDCCGPRRN